MSEVVRAALAAVVEGGTLTRAEAHGAMGAIMDGEATPSQLAALLVALRMRGESTAELAGLASAKPPWTPREERRSRARTRLRRIFAMKLGGIPCASAMSLRKATAPSAIDAIWIMPRIA